MPPLLPRSLRLGIACAGSSAWSYCPLSPPGLLSLLVRLSFHRPLSQSCSHVLPSPLLFSSPTVVTGQHLAVVKMFYCSVPVTEQLMMAEEKTWTVLTGPALINDHWPQVELQTLLWYISLWLDFQLTRVCYSTFSENWSITITLVIYGKTNLTDPFYQRPIE